MSDTSRTLAKAKKAYEASVKPAAKNKSKKVRILLPVAGKFLLPYDVGQEVLINENMAAELVDAKYAEYINK